MGDNPSVVKVADPPANGAFDGSFVAPSSCLSPVTALAALGFPAHKKDKNSPVLTACAVGFCLGFRYRSWALLLLFWFWKWWEGWLVRY